MIAKNDVAKIYETLLSIPGMNQPIKMSFQTSRRNLLLLHKLIEKAIHGKDGDDKGISLLESVSPETLNELSQIGYELLHKAELTEMNEKLKAL